MSVKSKPFLVISSLKLLPVERLYTRYTRGGKKEPLPRHFGFEKKKYWRMRHSQKKKNFSKKKKNRGRDCPDRTGVP
jgi:hypothetical protein